MDSVDYKIRFGSAFSIDQFGFVGQGKVGVEADKVVFSGRKHWSVLMRLLIFLLITVVPFALIGFTLVWFVALVVIHYFCTSSGTLTIEKSTITNIQRKGWMIRFKGQHPDSGKTKRTVFKVYSEEIAVKLEKELHG